MSFQSFSCIGCSDLVDLAGSECLNSMPVLRRPSARPQPVVFSGAGPSPAGRGLFVSLVLFGCVFPASLCFLLTPLSGWIHFFLDFRPSSCRYSDAPLPSVLYKTDDTLIGGTLHLIFGPPASRLSTVGLFARCCCCFDVLMTLVLHSADGLVIGIDSILHPQAPLSRLSSVRIVWSNGVVAVLAS